MIKQQAADELRSRASGLVENDNDMRGWRGKVQNRGAQMMEWNIQVV